MSINKPENIKWYVDAAFKVHNNTRSHTSGFMTTGTGGDYVQSSKQNLNNKSSTEAKIFGVNDFLTQVI